MIRTLGVNGGTGFAYEYAGPTIEGLSIEERMTICNMSIEGGARVGYVNPDEKTFEYLKGRPYCPKGKDWDTAVAEWRKVASDPDAVYERVVKIDASSLVPQVACPHTVDNVKPVGEVAGKAVQQVVIGSCTNGRLDDLAAASPAVQVAAFKLVLERRSGDCVLSPDVKIVATANRRDDKSGATTLPAALRTISSLATSRAACSRASSSRRSRSASALSRIRSRSCRTR